MFLTHFDFTEDALVDNLYELGSTRIATFISSFNEGPVSGTVEKWTAGAERPPVYSRVSEHDCPSDEVAAPEANCQFGNDFRKTAHIQNLNSSFLA